MLKQRIIQPVRLFLVSILMLLNSNLVSGQLIPYDQMFEISRLDGRGNMGISIDLTDEAISHILYHNKIDKPIYQPGKSPVKVVVGDAENHALGYFQLKFRDYGSFWTAADTASWTIYRYNEVGGTLLDSINSEATINFGLEQYISQWNMYVTIEQMNYFSKPTVLGLPKILTRPIEATIEFENPNYTWLTGVKDLDGVTPQNWILSGDDNFSDSVPCYSDVVKADENENFETLLDGTITHFSLLRYCELVAPIGSNSSFSVSTAQNQVGTASSNSVDLIFTTDKTKWTRSAVVELCQDSQLAQGGGFTSKPRIHASVDKNGYSAGHPSYNASEGDLISSQGMGWFPGYAIDVETGRRLNIVFGENSAMPEENGADMVWNPTATLYDGDGNPKFGGQHVIYVMGENVYGSEMPIYDSCQTFFNWTYSSNGAQNRNAWKSNMWVMYPLLEEGEQLLETDVKVRIRVVKAYENYLMTGENAGRPMFEWNLPVTVSHLNIEEMNLAEKHVKIYPNPASTSFVVEWDGIAPNSILIFSAQGKQVYKTEIEKSESRRVIDIEKLTPGVYFVEVGTHRYKLLVQ